MIFHLLSHGGWLWYHGLQEYYSCTLTIFCALLDCFEDGSFVLFLHFVDCWIGFRAEVLWTNVENTHFARAGNISLNLCPLSHCDSERSCTSHSRSSISIFIEAIKTTRGEGKLRSNFRNSVSPKMFSWKLKTCEQVMYTKSDAVHNPPRLIDCKNVSFFWEYLHQLLHNPITELYLEDLHLQ